MNYNYLKYFRILAQTQHYTHASELLKISQPSLSHAIHELEKELGISLFEKQGRNIQLTKYGKIYYEYIDRGLNTIEHGTTFVQSISSLESGTIDLGFIYTLGSFFIPHVLQSFLSVHPGIHFNLHQGTSTSIIQSLIHQEFDIGFCSKLHHHDQINFIPILKEEMVLVVSNKHPLAKCKSVDLSKINDQEPWILYSKKSGLRPYIDQTFEKLNIQPKIRCEIEEDSVALGFVNINYGISIMPKVSAMKLYDVTAIPIENQLEERTIYLATLKNRYLTPAIHNFISYVMQNDFQNKLKK